MSLRRTSTRHPRDPGLQLLVCDGCGHQVAWDAWYTDAGVYPTGWLRVAAFNGASYELLGELCPRCAPADAPSPRAVFRALWDAYQASGTRADNIPPAWTGPRSLTIPRPRKA